MTKLESILEKLIQFFTGSDYQREVLEAKREFFERAGIIDEESVNFETRMSQFLDWYMFSRELSDVHLPPVNFYVDKFKEQISQDEMFQYENLTKTYHSLFEFVKIRDSDVVIRCLFTKNKYTLVDSLITAGFTSDEVFEARLIPSEKSWIFTRGFCFHPAEASKFIMKEIKQVKHLDHSHKEALMLKLLKMRYKFEQYKHIRLEFIYSNDGRLKI
jgi:hypothetical protein